MSSDFKLVNITDSTIEDITSELTLPVICGANSNTFQTFNAQASGGTNQIQFNVQVPSLSTIVSRHFLCQSTFRITLNIAGGVTAGYWAANEVLYDYGVSNSLGVFPLNALVTTMMSNLNNATVSVNSREVLAGLLKLCNYEDLARYNSMTPSLVDSFYQKYVDGLGSNNNTLANYSVGSYAKEFQPRGAYPVSLLEIDGTPINGLKVVASDAGTAPFASFMIEFNVTEPLMFLSPFISGNSNNQAGFLGLNNLTLTLNLGTADRAISNSSYADLNGQQGKITKTISSVSLDSYSDAKLMLNFLTPPPMLYDKIESKNIVNYNQYTSYNYSINSPFNAGTNMTYSFNNVQLNQVPNKILIFARPQNMDSYTSNFFYVIKSLSINFSNKSGLLSSASPIQLYDMSVRNGLQMSYYEYSGSGVSNNSAGLSGVVPTIGSIAVIDPAIDLSIDAQLSNMSGGQFNMQFNVELQNQTADSENITLYLVTVNSGIFITENGSSSFVTGMLNQEMVLDTKSKTPITDKETYEKRIVGGSVENLGAIHKHVKQQYSHATEHENNVDMQGSGENAGVMSGGFMNAGAMSGGKTGKPMHRRVHKFL